MNDCRHCQTFLLDVGTHPDLADRCVILGGPRGRMVMGYVLGDTAPSTISVHHRVTPGEIRVCAGGEVDLWSREEADILGVAWRGRAITRIGGNGPYLGEITARHDDLPKMEDWIVSILLHGWEASLPPPVDVLTNHSGYTWTVNASVAHKRYRGDSGPSVLDLIKSKS